MASSFESLVFNIIASDKDASAAFDRFRSKVDQTSGSVDKNSASLDKNSKSLDKNAQSNKSALGAVIGTGLALAPISGLAIAAGAGFGAFAGLAVPSVTKISKALTGPGGLAANWSTLDQRQKTAAVGIQALGKDYGALAKTLEPQVFQVFNQGLTLAHSLLGPVGQLAKTSGQGISDFLAQFSQQSGVQHFISFLATQARPAFDLIGTDVTHLSHALFQLIESFAGPGLLEMKALTAVFVGLDDAITFLTQHAPALASVALGIGGIALALSKIGALSGVLKLTGLAAIATDMEGFAAATAGATLAEKGMLAATVALDAISPLGWIILAAAGIAALAVAFGKTRSATDDQITAIQRLTDAQGFNTKGYAQAAESIGAVNDIQKEQKTTLVNLHTGMVTGTIDTGNLTGATKTLTDAQQRNAQSGASISKFLDILQQKYGISRDAAIALAKQSGVLAGSVAKGGAAIGTAASKAEGFANSMIDAANPAKTMNANLFVMNTNATNAASGITKINTAWDTFLGMSTGIENAQTGIITNLKQMSKDAGAAGASFTGVNANSITLRNDFESNLAPSIQDVINKMRAAHSTSHDLATVISTDLKPAVDKGALANQGMRNQIFDMAQEAGYTGPNKIRPLTNFIDGNATSTRKADKIVQGYAADLAKIPKNEHTNIGVSGSGSWSVNQLLPGGGGRSITHAAGWRVPGYGGGDIHPALLEGGETVVPKHLTPAVAPLMAAHGVPGFAAGGIVGNYNGAGSGLGKWVLSEDASTIRAIAQSVASAFAAAGKAASAGGGGFGAAGPGGGAPSANAALARAMFPGENFSAWNYVAMRESGWNQFADNPSSGAYGIAQALPPTKYPFAGQAAGGSNPAAQISWMEGYMRSRYGGAAGAAAHELAFNWYDQGGYLPVGASIAFNGTGRPEPVGRAAGGNTYNITVNMPFGSTKAEVENGIAQVLDDLNRRHRLPVPL